MAWLTVAGIATSAGGAALSADDANSKRKAAFGIANTPGLDLNGIVDESLAGFERTLPRSQALTNKINEGNQDELNKLYEKAIPGFGNIQSTRSNLIQQLLRGEVPSDVALQVGRSSAGRAAALGISGTGAGHNLSARDFGLTSLGIQQQGLNAVPGLISSTPMAPFIGSQTFGFTPQQIAGVRGGERTQKLNMLIGANNMQTGEGVWANMLSGLGGTLTGAGLGRLGGGMGGMGGGGDGGGSVWQGGNLTTDNYGSYNQGKRARAEAGLW